MKFSSQNWRELGTIRFFESEGFYAIAVDLPGFGKSDNISMEKDAILLILIDKLELSNPLIVAPSMSGAYSLPVVADSSSKISGFVAVAPTNIPDYVDKLNGNPLPALAIWGSNDEVVPHKDADLLCKSMTNVKKVVLKNAGHPCYINETDAFHRQLLGFFRSVS